MSARDIDITVKVDYEPYSVRVYGFQMLPAEPDVGVMYPYIEYDYFGIIMANGEVLDEDYLEDSFRRKVTEAIEDGDIVEDE